MRGLLFSFLLLLCIKASAQDGKDSTAMGQWRGSVKQYGTPIVDYKVAFTLNPGYGNAVVGISRYVRTDGASVEMRFDGELQGNSASITEKEVTKSKPVDGKWCLKHIRLNYKHNGKTGIDSLSGYWEGVSAYDNQFYFQLGVVDNNGVVHRCDPGEIHLWRQGKKDSIPPPPKKEVIAVAPVIEKKIEPKKSNRPRDGYFDKTAIATSKVTPYQPLREADVAMLKRVWRDIDVREKMNTYLASPKARLIDVLLDGIKNDKLIIYNPQSSKDDPDGDGFSSSLTAAQALAALSDSSLVTIRDKDNNIVSSKMTANEFAPDSMLRFRIKEDWIFDKQRSVFEPRIIGIAPLIRIKAPGMTNADMQPAFWIYFPQLRPLLAVKEVANANNDQTGLSFDDVFMKRMFSSYIVKQSNNEDLRIKDYMQGIDRLYEAQRIGKSLMDWELDLWQY